MDILLPCLNRLKKTDGSPGAFDISFGATPGGIATDVEFAALAVDLALLLLAPELFIIFPFMPFGWDWAFDALGLGPTDIEIQKKQIQAYLTPVFKMLNQGYGFPLNMDKAQRFSSDAVKTLLGKRPDLAALVPLMQDESDRIITGAFGYDKSGPGIRQRLVNQFLANASRNQWPLQATIDAWQAIVRASTCPPPPKPPPPLPSVVPNLVAQPGNAQVFLGWDRASGTSQIPSKTFVYNVKRSETSGGPYVVVGTATGKTFTDSGVTNGTQYFYRVSATSSVGEGEDSNEASATPVAPPPVRPCPPGYDMDRCFEICGQIRQLTASQQPLGPFEAILDYFRDCIMPPDGSWQYRTPPVSVATEVYPVQGFPWMPKETTIGFLPPEYWPYNWNRGSGGRILIVVTAPPDSPYPPGTLITATLDPGEYVVLPDGTIDCFGDKKPPEEPLEGEPTPPDEPEPPVEEIPPAVQQLRQDVDELSVDYRQFKQSMLQSLSSIKQAVWNGFLRDNQQSATVWARGQAGWQGPLPLVTQPPIPPSWQEIPANGTPQVLELPPIQEFPQVLEIPPFDATALEQRIAELQEQNRQLNLEIEALKAIPPLDVAPYIVRYDTEVVQPGLQAIRDDCCQPVEPPPERTPVDICQEGRERWGVQAECWLDARTPDHPGPYVPPGARRAANEIGESVATYAVAPQQSRFASGADAAADIVLAALDDQDAPMGPLPYQPIVAPDYIFTPVPTASTPTGVT